MHLLFLFSFFFRGKKNRLLFTDLVSCVNQCGRVDCSSPSCTLHYSTPTSDDRRLHSTHTGYHSTTQYYYCIGVGPQQSHTPSQQHSVTGCVHSDIRVEKGERFLQRRTVGEVGNTESFPEKTSTARFHQPEQTLTEHSRIEPLTNYTVVQQLGTDDCFSTSVRSTVNTSDNTVVSVEIPL